MMMAVQSADAAPQLGHLLGHLIGGGGHGGGYGGNDQNSWNHQQLKILMNADILIVINHQVATVVTAADTIITEAMVEVNTNRLSIKA